MGVKKFTSEVIKEGKRVRWPKRDVLVPAFIVVVIIAALTALILMGEDALGKGLIDVLRKTFNSQEVLSWQMKSNLQIVQQI